MKGHSPKGRHLDAGVGEAYVLEPDAIARLRTLGRAAWRYGKEGYAVAVLAYFDAEGNDSPRACSRGRARNPSRRGVV